MTATLAHLTQVRSQRVEWVLAYLDKIAQNAAELPSYFPARLRNPEPNQPWPFDIIRQQLEVIEDRERYNQEQAKLNEQQRLTAEKTSPYSQNYKDLLSGKFEKGNGEKERTPLTFTWNDRAIERQRRIVILGDPGYGKSWLLKYEARRCALQQAQKLHAGQIDLEALVLPVHLRLDVLAKQCPKKRVDGDIVQAMLLCVKATNYKQPHAIDDWLREKLTSHHSLLLLDAWDEVPEKKIRPKLTEALHAFFNTYNQPKVILTSRIVGYIGKPLPGGKEMELLGFNRRQQQALAKVWYGENEAGLADFMASTQNQNTIRLLIRIPLMLNLALSCHLYYWTWPTRDRQAHFFPTRRVELYEHCLWGLLKLWPQEKKQGTEIDDLKVKDWLDNLARAAFQLLGKEQEIFTAEELLDALQKKNTPTSRRFIQTLRQQGILVRLGDENEPHLMFLHRTFQEFLTAYHLKNLIASKKQKEQDLGWETVEDWSWQPEKDIILELLAGLLEDPTPLLAHLADASTDGLFRGRLSLAARCLPEIAQTKRNAMVDQIEAIAKEVWTYVSNRLTFKQEDYDADGNLHNPSTIPALHGSGAAMNSAMVALGRVDARIDGVYWIDRLARVGLYDLLGEINTVRSVGLLIEISNNTEKEIKNSVIKGITKSNLDSAEDALIDLLSDEDRYINLMVLNALGEEIRSKKVVQPIIELLSNKANIFRHYDVLWALYNNRSNFAIAFLISLLSNNRIIDHKYVAMALEEIDSETAELFLFARLSDGDSNVRQAAVEVLGEFGSEIVLPHLVARLSDGDSNVRQAAVRVLGEFGSEIVLLHLVARLSDEDSNVRQAAVEVLGTFGSELVLPHLVARLSDGDSNVRQAAVRVLGEFGSELVLPHLVARLSDGDSNVRQAAVRVLGEFGSEIVLSHLVARLSDGDSNVRQAAVEVLGTFGSETALPHLITRLSDNDRDVRISAVMTLGNIGSKATDAIEPLIQCHSDEDRGVHEAVAEALGKIGSEKAVAHLITRLSDENWITRLSVAKALGRTGLVDSVVPLVNRLWDEYSFVRWRAAESLGKIGSTAVRAVDPLIQCLSDEDNRVIEEATIALGKIGSETAVAYLLAQLSDENNDVRKSAANSLGIFGLEEAVKPLIGCLSDKNTGVRWEAALSLWEIGSVTALIPLASCRSENHRFVRNVAISALEKITKLKESINDLCQTLMELDERANWTAFHALSRLGTGQETDLLQSKLLNFQLLPWFSLSVDEELRFLMSQSAPETITFNEAKWYFLATSGVVPSLIESSGLLGSPLFRAFKG